MSRRPFIGRKTARRACVLGLLGVSLGVAAAAHAGVVFVPPVGDGAWAVQWVQDHHDPLGATWMDELPSGWAVAPITEDSAGDPCVMIARQSQAALISSSGNIATPILEVAPTNPFDYSSLSTTRHVNSIPVLPAVWSGITGLGGLGATACIRRLRRSLR